MPPKLIIVHELCVLTIHVITRGATHEVRIQHPTLDRKAAFGESLPGMATLDRRPVAGQLLEAGTERHKDLRLSTHDCLGGSPLGEGPMISTWTLLHVGCEKADS